jgi:pyruvate formate lyase activating enzyme
VSVDEVNALHFNLQRYSVHDGPGIRTTLFLKGCPLRCVWCHNPESMAPEPQVWWQESCCIACRECVVACQPGARQIVAGRLWVDAGLCQTCGACAAVCVAGAVEVVGKPISVGEAVTAVEADRAFYERSGGGVTVSGGEPLMQAEFAERFLGLCRQRGLHTALDTSGFAPWPALERVARQADLVLFDVKHMDRSAHSRLTGVPNERILGNLRRLVNEGFRVAVRLPVVVGCNDEDRQFRALGEFLAECDAKPSSVDLLPYHKLGESKRHRLGLSEFAGQMGEPSAGRLEEIRSLLSDYGLTVTLPD